MSASGRIVHRLAALGAAASVLVAFGFLGLGSFELFSRDLPSVVWDPPAMFAANAEEGPLGALLAQAAGRTPFRGVSWTLLVLAAAALASASAYELGRTLGNPRAALLSVLLAAFLMIGWAEWRVVTGGWSAMLAGGFLGFALALGSRAAATVGAARRVRLTVASGALFGLALLARHAAWPALLPALCWFFPRSERAFAWRFVLAACLPLVVAGLLAVRSGALGSYATWLFAWNAELIPLSTRPASQLLSDSGLFVLVWLLPALSVLAGSRTLLPGATSAVHTGELTLAAWIVLFFPLSPFPSAGILPSLLVLAPAFGCLIALAWEREISHARYASGTLGARSGASGRALLVAVLLGFTLVGRTSVLNFDAHRSSIERQADRFE